MTAPDSANPASSSRSPRDGAASSRFLAAVRGEATDRPPPLWIMRQAGRYLPEYREVRQRHSFVEMCTTPEIAVEISLQPWRRFEFDAVIVFYDILFVPEVMGAPLEFTDKGPVFHHPVRDRAAVEALHAPDLEAEDPKVGTGAILASLRALRSELPDHTALLGFAGAPFTLAAYLVEGRFGRTGDRMRRLMYEDPALVHSLLERLTDATGDYLALQVAAGADAVQLFDTWAGLLGPREYDEFALPYQKRVFEAVRAAGAPATLYVLGGGHLLDNMARSGAGVLSIDWRQDLAAVRASVGPDIALQGNLDPSCLFADPAVVEARAKEMVAGMAGDARYIANLGHGILPETPVASVEAFVRVVRGG